MSEKKMNSSRRAHLKSLMLSIAKNLLEVEVAALKQEKEAYMSENCPSPNTSGGLAELQEMIKLLGQSLDKIDEERYDIASKVNKADKEIEDLKMKVVEIQGMKKPALKKVRLSADAMLSALLGSKHKVTIDFKANLKQVKKEVKEEEEVGDWRKNVDEQAGMDGRKKKFESA